MSNTNANFTQVRNDILRERLGHSKWLCPPGHAADGDDNWYHFAGNGSSDLLWEVVPTLHEKFKGTPILVL